jgi:hypothetical protein
MVKVFLLFVMLSSTVMFAQEGDSFGAKSSLQDPLSAKIESFLGEKSYRVNKNFIRAIFDPKRAFYKNGRVDSVKVIAKLKENGLLKLFFKTPQEFQLNFQTSGSPLFFVKLMGDALRNIGYYRYVTTASHLDSSAFVWSINLTSEYATDPLVLQKELAKSGCRIVDIEKNSPKEWTYSVDISHARLHVPMLYNHKKVKLRRSLYAYWFNVSKIRKLQIQSAAGNQWHPYISYYDAALHLVKIVKKARVSHGLTLTIPKNATYVKISDLYTLKNVRAGLLLLPLGSR